jgi:predicted amidohydrolase
LDLLNCNVIFYTFEYENRFNPNRIILGKSIRKPKTFQKKINSISENIDLIVLLEMFTSGFTMNPETVAETMNGETIQLLKTLAKAKNCAITESLVITENNNFYNRMVFFQTQESIFI